MDRPQGPERHAAHLEGPAALHPRTPGRLHSRRDRRKDGGRPSAGTGRLARTQRTHGLPRRARRPRRRRSSASYAKRAARPNKRRTPGAGGDRFGGARDRRPGTAASSPLLQRTTLRGRPFSYPGVCVPPSARLRKSLSAAFRTSQGFTSPAHGIIYNQLSSNALR